MSADQNRLAYLTGCYLHDQCSAAEIREFWNLLAGSVLADPLQEELDKLWEESAHAAVKVPAEGWDQTLSLIYRRANQWSARERPVFSLGWSRRVAAASIIILMLLGIDYWVNVKNTHVYAMHTDTTDIQAPATSKAMIHLAGDKVLLLENVRSEVQIQEGGIKLVKLGNGVFAYQSVKGITQKDPEFHELINPAGSIVTEMVLADGTKVWLNAGSSLRYPVAFQGRERRVSVSGEVYFEVLHDPHRPFIAEKGDLCVRVLGTHFNMHVYEAESKQRISLVKGMVKVSKGRNAALLRPGQQAEIADRVKVVDGVNMQQVLAWKNAQFDFGEGTGIDEVLRQVCRWYGVETVYQGNIKMQEYGGVISKKISLSKLLEKLELTGGVKFQLVGRKIIVRAGG
jgi:hypothetical protein